MSYVQLAKIADDVDFIAATKSMGWDETNYQEVLHDLNGIKGFIPNFDIEKKKLGKVEVVKEAVVYGTIGGEEGNRWYNLEGISHVFKDKNGKFWADGEEALFI